MRIQEAFMVRSHPQWLLTRSLIKEGRIGDLRAIVGAFSYYNDNPANIRNVPDWGGGALMDIGCYLINTSRFLLGREPLRVSAAIDRDPAMQVDRLTSMLLDYEGVHLVGTCSMQMVPYQRMQIFGTRGLIDIRIPFNAPPDRPCEIVVDTGKDLFGGGQEVLMVPVCDQYTIQGDLFSKAVLDGQPAPEPLEDSIRNMECIEAVFRAAESGRWEAVTA
jgi:predicted dehydrogenase